MSNLYVRNTDKMRLLLLYLIHVDGGLESDRRRLEEVPESLTLEDKRAAINLQHLGVPTKKASTARRSKTINFMLVKSMPLIMYK